MSSSKRVVVAFDLYGTLLSTASISARLAEHFGQAKAEKLAKEWRTLQLEYTWRLTAMSKYESFSALTLKALKHALADAGLTLQEEQLQSLMRAYDSLSTFSDVESALKDLQSHKDISAVIFSNGTPEMVEASVQQSEDLAPHASVFDKIVTVHGVGKFKPSPDVYKHLAREVGKDEQEMGSIWLVSSNPFDVVGARVCGMKVAWVDRTKNGWTDRLCGPDEGPTVIVDNLNQVVNAVRSHAGD